MNKYCTNCGKELNLESDYCLNCGKLIPKNSRNLKTKSKTNTFEVLGVVGMIAGLLGFYLSFMLSLFTSSAADEISSGLVGINEDLILYKLFFAFGYILIGIVPSITGLIMTLMSVKREKTICGMVGLVSSLVSIVFCVGIVLFLIK